MVTEGVNNSLQNMSLYLRSVFFKQKPRTSAVHFNVENYHCKTVCFTMSTYIKSITIMVKTV